MSLFEGDVLQQTVAVASKHKIEPAALLAVVEVESGGRSLEADGKTPCLLFERHIFYRELNKVGKAAALTNAIAMGLANETWQPATQYRDEGSSQKRLALFNRASNIDEECAIRSCSWGVGQTMGFLAEQMHFRNARAMLAYMRAGGVPAQVECMIREIENKKLGQKLNAHDWAGFARVYNGPGYAKNRYDQKMAQAWAKWKTTGVGPVTQPKPVDVPPDVKPAPTPPPPPVSTTQAGAGAGIAAFFAGLWAALKNLDPQLVAFGVFILILLVATGAIIWHRRKLATIPQLGVLSTVEGG